MRWYGLPVGVSVWLTVSGCDIWKGASEEVPVFMSDVTASEVVREAKEVGAGSAFQPNPTALFEERVGWPVFSPESVAGVYRIVSGTDEDGAWFSGRGYFRRTLSEILADMSEPQRMGPSNVTDSLERVDFVSDDEFTAYTMQVKVSMVMTIEFELGVKIRALHEDASDPGRRTGLYYESHKTGGTRFIKRIDEFYIVREVEGGWLSIEFQSVNRATVTKEDDTRAHFEELFARWAASEKE